MASHEADPRTDLERFFRLCKRWVVEGFLYSTAGRREALGYKGDTALPQFPGCSHPEHLAE